MVQECDHCPVLRLRCIGASPDPNRTVNAHSDSAGASQPSPDLWLLTVADVLVRSASSDTAGVIAVALRHSLLALLADAVAQLTTGVSGTLTDAQRSAARAIVAALVDALPASNSPLDRDVDLALGTADDAWVGAVWLVIHAVGTNHLWPSDWSDVETLAEELQRRPLEPRIAWRRRQATIVARYIADRRADAAARRELERDLLDALLRIFGSPVEGYFWMTTRVPALGGRTPTSTVREGVDGIRRVLHLLSAIETSTYQ
jgi:hypothetical protein